MAADAMASRAGEWNEARHWFVALGDYELFAPGCAIDEL